MNFSSSHPSSIVDTPQGSKDNKNDRVNRERNRRSKEKDALARLRQTLEAAEPNAFWRMEKADIIDGACKCIRRLTGVSVESSEREQPAVSEKNLARGEVEKRRRAREAAALNTLKELLIKHCPNAHAKLEKLEVLLAAIDLIKKLADLKLTSPSGTVATNSPDSGTGSSPESSPGTVVVQPVVLSPSLNDLLLLSMMQQAAVFSQLNSAVLQSTPVPPTVSNHDTSDEPAAKRSRSDTWRPWE